MSSVPLRVARLLVAWVFTAAYWTSVFLLQAVTLRSLPDAFLQTAARRWGYAVMRLLGIRLEVEGPSFDTREPRVIVFNHQSALDMLWCAAMAPPAVLALGKSQIVYVPFVNMGWWALDFMTVDRKHPRKAVESFSLVAEAIARDRRSLLISPEGTRTRDGSVLPFKRGAFQLAVRAQAPIHPVVVSGAFELLHRTEWLPRPGVIRLRCLPPIETRGLGEADTAALAERVREEIVRAYAAR